MKWLNQGFEYDYLYHEITECMAAKKLFFWGAGIEGQKVYSLMKSASPSFKIAGFLDNDINKQKCHKILMNIPGGGYK